MRSASCRSANRPPSRSVGVEFASFGLMLIRSTATSRLTVPAVSIVMCIPARLSVSQSGVTPPKIIGSPPVSTT
jgi:hypothetical protein